MILLLMLIGGSIGYVANEQNDYCNCKRAQFIGETCKKYEPKIWNDNDSCHP